MYQKEGKITLSIADNGIGLPEEHKIEKAETLGLQLVNTLVEQIEGEIEINKERGTKFSIVFNSNVEE